ncbi:MAG: type II toxin-antitoxin system HicB family antitoxin, partial [bacterium]
MRLKVLVHTEPEGGYWAEVPAIPGCMTQGETMAELRVNLREAVSACMEILQERAQATIVPVSGTRVLEMAL